MLARRRTGPGRQPQHGQAPGDQPPVARRRRSRGPPARRTADSAGRPRSRTPSPAPPAAARFAAPSCVAPPRTGSWKMTATLEDPGANNRTDIRAAGRPADPGSTRIEVLLVAEAFGGGVFELVRMVAEGICRAQGTGSRSPSGAGPRRRHAPRERDRRRRRADRDALAATARRRRWSPARGACDELIRRPRPRRRSSLLELRRGDRRGRRPRANVPTVFTPQAYAFTIDGGAARRAAPTGGLERFASRRATVVGACSEDEARLARGLGARTVVTVAERDPRARRRAAARSQPADPARVIALGRTVPQRRPAAAARILAEVDRRRLGGLDRWRRRRSRRSRRGGAAGSRDRAQRLDGARRGAATSSPRRPPTCIGPPGTGCRCRCWRRWRWTRS